MVISTTFAAIDLATITSSTKTFIGTILALVGVVAFGFVLFKAIIATAKGRWKETGKMVGAGAAVGILAFGGLGLLIALSGQADDIVNSGTAGVGLGEVKVDTSGSLGNLK